MRGNGPRRGRGSFPTRRGGKSGKPSAIPPRRNFEAARVEEKRSESGSSDEASDAEPRQPLSEPPSLDDESDSESSGGEEEEKVSKSYGKLLFSLAVKRSAKNAVSGKPKKQKLKNDARKDNGDVDLLSQSNVPLEQPELLSDDHRDPDHPEAGEGSSDAEDQGEDDDVQGSMDDPFEAHFASSDTKVWSQYLKSDKERPQCPTYAKKGTLYTHRTRTTEWGDALTPLLPKIWRAEDVHFKQKLKAKGLSIWTSFTEEVRDFAKPLFSYRDCLFALRRTENTASLRQAVLLHAMNHVFKTRDRVLKNNSKLAQASADDVTEIRDQGFTRPKVLIILPTKQACVRFIESLVEICEPEQQENKSRFFEDFSQDADEAWEEKPRDFQDLFGGNDDDMFRIGLKFTRKTLKFFSAFYSSDIILASPLGLRRAIESGKSKEGKPLQDSDFLSSIEILIMDHATALLMQNWQHIEYIFSHLNLIPKESHGCDFSRVRHWYLDGLAKYFRQTIILSDFLTPEIKSLCTKHLQNIAGIDEYVTTVPNPVLDTAASTLPFPITQVFQRFHPPSPKDDSDARFDLFTSTILPSLLPSNSSQTSSRSKPARTLIYTSTYVDFLRVRNHLSTSPSTVSLSFGAISEYTSVRDVARARSHFMSGRHSVLLYSERAHHFRRYVLRGVKGVVFYALPENPVFWTEVVRMLGVGDDSSDNEEEGTPKVRALFSRFDALKLERIVGCDRQSKMVYRKEGDVFEFT